MFALLKMNSGTNENVCETFHCFLGISRNVSGNTRTFLLPSDSNFYIKIFVPFSYTIGIANPVHVPSALLIERDS
jgi:hypothetical protein